MDAKATKRWTFAIGTVVLVGVAAELVSWAVWNVLWPRGKASAKAASMRVYDAAADDYRGARASPQAISTLRAWDAERGPPASYRVREPVFTQILGHPSYVTLEVRRGARTYVETLYLPDSKWVSGVSGGK